MDWRQFLAAGMMGVFAALSGCATTTLLAPGRYTEEFDSILLSEDGKQLVVMTKEYHYVFGDVEILSQILRDGMHGYLSANITDVHVDADNRAQAKVIFFLEENFSPQRAREETGLKWDEDGRFAASLYGRRYASGGIRPTLPEYRLQKQYQVCVTEERSSAEKAALIPLTPVAVAVDGVLILGMVPLAMVGVVVWNTLDSLNGIGR